MTTTKKTAVTKKAAATETKTVAEKTTKTTATKATTTKTTASKKKYVYVFFNCDDDKSAASMNVLYNNEVFTDTAAGRKALLKKIEEECANGRVNIADKTFVEEAIIKGEPTEAGSKLQYGSIERMALIG